MTTPSSRKLTLTDIADQRAYERERDEFRTHIIELKRKRRVGVGPIITLLFENRDTIRFQVQEMARVEKLISDEAIEGELKVYNPLIPDPGMLCATLFLELTDDLALREWLPRMVGIERAVKLVIGSSAVGRDEVGRDEVGRDEVGRDEVGRDELGREDGGETDPDEVWSIPEEAHEAQLTRPETTASVHYIWFELNAEQIERFAQGPVSLVVDHDHYQEATVLSDATVAELLADLRDSPV